MKFDPFGQWGKAYETWQKMADDSIARTTAFYAEMEKAETKHVSQAELAIEEMAKIQKETLAYSVRLASEMRKLSLEAFQNATSTFASSTAA
jgi:hypothetical protein